MKTIALVLIGLLVLGLLFGCTQTQPSGPTDTNNQKNTSSTVDTSTISQSIDGAVITDDVNVGDVLP